MKPAKATVLPPLTARNVMPAAAKFVWLLYRLTPSLFTRVVQTIAERSPLLSRVA